MLSPRVIASLLLAGLVLWEPAPARAQAKPVKPEDTAGPAASEPPANPSGDSGSAAPKGVAEVTVTAAKEGPPPEPDYVETPFAGLSEKISQDDLRRFNAPNVGDSVKYLPSVFVRKRYIGDRNGVIAIRGNSEFQTGRTLVLADGVLLSDFLQNQFNAPPRWDLVAPEEIESSEVLYGPHSAIYSGNSLGGTVLLRTRLPDGPRLSLQSSGFIEHFEMYGTDDEFGGFKNFVSWGNRIGRFAYYFFYNRLESDSHPMTYNGVTALRRPVAERRLTGVFPDHDQRGADRFIVGSTGPQHDEHQTLKAKFGYEFTPDLRARFTAAFLRSDEDRSEPENYLRDAAGNQVFSGTGQFNGSAFTITPGNFSVEERKREDVLLGLTVEGKIAGEWGFETTGSWYSFVKDDRAQSNRNPKDPLYTLAGQVSHFGDTGWMTYDFKVGTRKLFGEDALRFYTGYHFDQYDLEFKQFASNDWKSYARDRLINANGGTTRTHALYAELEWEFLDGLAARAGVRQEWWEAEDGFLSNGVRKANHPDREFTEPSPKFSLCWTPEDRWRIQLALSRAVRFPVVSELFQGSVNPATGDVANSDPGLEPEDSFSKALEITRILGDEDGRATLSFFEDDVREAIFRQTGVVDGATITSFQNITQVRTRGVELSLEEKGLVLEDLDLRINGTYIDAEIEKNVGNTSVEGNQFPRVPDFRAGLLATYHLTDQWDVSLGGRHQGRRFGDLDNQDKNGRTFNGQSKFLVFDFKTSWEFGPGKSIGFGIDNLLDEDYFAVHPFPQRTFFLEGEWRF